MSLMNTIENQQKNGLWSVVQDADRELYRCICPQCRQVIGVFAASTLLSGLALTANKGGLLCPECRLRTCDFCTRTWESKLELCTLEEPFMLDGNWRERFCLVCSNDLMGADPYAEH